MLEKGKSFKNLSFGLALGIIIMWIALGITSAIEKLSGLPIPKEWEKIISQLIPLFQNIIDPAIIDKLQQASEIWSFVQSMILVAIVIVAIIGVLLQLPNLSLHNRKKQLKIGSVLYRLIFAIVSTYITYAFFLKSFIFEKILQIQGNSVYVFVYLILILLIIQLISLAYLLIVAIKEHDFKSSEHYVQTITQVTTKVALYISGIQIVAATIFALIFRIVASAAIKVNFSITSLAGTGKELSDLAGTPIGEFIKNTLMINIENADPQIIDDLVNQAINNFIIGNAIDYIFKKILFAALVIGIVFVVILVARLVDQMFNIEASLAEKEKMTVTNLILSIVVIIVLLITNALILNSIFVILFILIAILNAYTLFKFLKEQGKFDNIQLPKLTNKKNNEK